MLEWVVLGVAGVLQPREALWTAEVATAEAWLGARGTAPRGLRAALLERLRRGEPAPVTRTLRGLGLVLTATEERALVLAMRQAVPVPGASAPRPAMQRLRSRYRLGVLDTGPGARMEAWISQLAVADLVEQRLWTDDLGHQARPPRRLAFRWLAERLEASSGQCLYVAGTEPLREAARRAGWRVVGGATPRAGALDLDTVVDAIDRLAPGEEAANS